MVRAINALHRFSVGHNNAVRLLGVYLYIGVIAKVIEYQLANLGLPFVDAFTIFVAVKIARACGTVAVHHQGERVTVRNRFPRMFKVDYA